MQSKSQYYSLLNFLIFKISQRITSLFFNYFALTQLYANRIYSKSYYRKHTLWFLSNCITSTNQSYNHNIRNIQFKFELQSHITTNNHTFSKKFFIHNQIRLFVSTKTSITSLIAIIILSKEFSNFKIHHVCIESQTKKEKRKTKIRLRGRDYNVEMTTQFMSWGAQTCSPRSDPVRSFNPSEIATYD